MAQYTSEIIDHWSDIPVSEFEHVLSSSGYSSIYHHPGYLRAIENGLGRDPAHILVYKDGSLVGLLPNTLAEEFEGSGISRLVSLQPGSGGIVLTGDELEVFNVIREAINTKFGASVVSQTIRSSVPQHLLLNLHLEDAGYRPSVGAEFELDLNQGWEQILDGMSKDRRYDIRKGSDQEFEIVDLESTNLTIGDFYSHFEAKMNELSKSAKPKRFFEILHSELGDRMKVFAMRADGDIRGYHLYFVDEYQSKIRHEYMAVLRENFRYSPGELMHKHAIKWGIENGFTRYGFGGGKADLESGTTKYKRQYGGKLIPFITWEKEFSKIYQAGRFLTRRF